MNRAHFVLLTSCAFLTLGACGSSSVNYGAPSATDPTTTSTTRARASLEFREVEAEYPWTAEPGTTNPNSLEPQDAFPGCEKLIEDSELQTASEERAILRARSRESCFVVGPVLVSGDDVDAAYVLFDSTASQFAINVHFRNDEFLDKIAEPLINKQIAIVLDGVVLSAPTINPGITGRDVEITGQFTKQAAIDAAASILGVPRSSVRIDSTNAPG